MKNKMTYIYCILFCCTIFSFATAILPYKMAVSDWLMTLLIWTFAACISILLTADNRETKPVADLASLIYIFFMIGRTMHDMNIYMKTYHRQSSAFINIAVTVFVIILTVGYDNIKIKKLSNLLFFMVITMLGLAVSLNFNKVSPVNLYTHRGMNNGCNLNVTLFDYIIPANIILNSYQKANRKKAVLALFACVSVIFTVIIFTFSCLKGDLLYSISPLQILFQISSGNQISNFDAYYNFLLWFAYFAAIILLVNAYSCIKSRFSYFSELDLLFILPCYYLSGLISGTRWLYAMIILSIILSMCKEKRGYYEKI